MPVARVQLLIRAFDDSGPLTVRRAAKASTEPHERNLQPERRNYTGAGAAVCGNTHI